MGTELGFTPAALHVLRQGTLRLQSRLRQVSVGLDVCNVRKPHRLIRHKVKVEKFLLWVRELENEESWLSVKKYLKIKK